MKRLVMMTILLTCIMICPTFAKGLQDEMKTDVVLRALVDEIERNQKGLKLEGLESPYFIEFALQEIWSFNVMADLGSVVMKGDDHNRAMRSDVRVGSYELDNTNFSGGSYGYFGFGGGGFTGGSSASLPIEDDYNAIRQAIWWAADRDYKSVVETFEKKKAFMKNKVVEDKPADFSKEKPTIYFEDKLRPNLHMKEMQKRAVEVSRIFRDFPDIQDSSVTASAAGGNKYLVNTEGTRIRISGQRFTIEVTATTQTDDGMKFTDSFTVTAKKFEDFVPLDEIKKRTKAMIDRLLKVRNAPTLDSYTGPVLFDAEPATELFGSRFANRFAGGQRPVGSSSSPDDFEKKIDKRILPKHVNVIDDATIEKVAGVPALGHYTYDDQGVKARPVTLVEKGRLKAQVMSRNPSKIADRSTGHGRGIYGPSASVSVLVVSSEDGMNEEEMREELLLAAEDEDLEFALRVARMGEVGGGDGGGFFFGRGGGGYNPLEMYKVYPDGREEMVRGARMSGLNLRSFKRMLAMGDTPYVMNRTSGTNRTIVAPAMLFEELDLAKIDREFDKPPILENPLGRTE